MSVFSTVLSTPREHLPAGFPLPSGKESRKFEPIWIRAFEIHRNAHDFQSQGPWQYRDNILAAIEGDPHYCDCYERAYIEFQMDYERAKRLCARWETVFVSSRSLEELAKLAEREPRVAFFLETKRKIQLEA
jgi:hypothetical protein